MCSEISDVNEEETKVVTGGWSCKEWRKLLAAPAAARGVVLLAVSLWLDRVGTGTCGASKGGSVVD